MSSTLITVLVVLLVIGAILVALGIVANRRRALRQRFGPAQPCA